MNETETEMNASRRLYRHVYTSQIFHLLQTCSFSQRKHIVEHYKGYIDIYGY